MGRALGDALLRVRASGETNSVVSSAVVEALVGMGSAGTAEALRLAKGASQTDRYDGRSEGFEVLEGLGPKASAAVPYLLDVIGDEVPPDEPVNYVSDAVEALAAMREAVLPDLCRTITRGILASPKSRERRAAEAALWAIARSKYEAPQPTTCMAEAARSADPQLRRFAISAAGSLGGGDAIRILARGLLEDPDPDVRESAAGKIKELGDPALPSLEQAIRSPVQGVRESGWFALSWVEKTPAKEALLRRLEVASDQSLRVKASLMAAQQFGVDEQGLTNLPAIMRSNDEHERYQAVPALSAAPRGHPVTDQILGLALADPSSLVRRSAYEFITEKTIASPRIGEPLFASISRRLDAGDEDERREAEARLAALALFVDRERDRVQQMLSSGDLAAKLEMAEAIKLGQAGARFADDLIALLGAKDFDLQVAGRDALLSGGPAVVAKLLFRLSTSGAAQEKILEILALADADGKSVPEIVRLAQTPAMQGGALAALMALGERSDAARSALVRLWPTLPAAAKVSAVRKVKRYGPLEGEQMIAWALAELRQPDPAWSQELLTSLSLHNVTAEQVALAETLEPELRASIIEKLAFDAPERISQAQFSRLLADADTFNTALDLIADLPPDVAEMLELPALPLRQASDRPLVDRLALARASNGFALEPRLALWQQGLADSSDAVRIATLNAIASATTSNLAALRIGPSNDPALLALRSVTARVRTLLEGESDPQVLIPAIRAYPMVADPFDESVNKVLEFTILASDEETASVAVLALKKLPGGLDTLDRLRFKVNNEIIARYIAKALEPPGIAYDRSPPFYGFDSDFPRLLPWPPGKFTDRITFEPSEIGSRKTTLGSFLHRLKTAARLAGFPEPSIYAIPGGFAAAFAPERLGVPGSQRWSLGKLPLVTVNPADYFRRLFLGTDETYRWLVFYATSRDFAAPGTQLELEEARGWAQIGYSGLPSQVAEQLASGYSIGVLSYDFLKDDTSIRAFANLSVSQPLHEHLRAIGLYDALFSPLQLAERRN
ncbi:HEAT repeat domain-containing protein [Rhizobium leguminosarum]|uniref:HEAT repeat domain-containing protein n=1 Tax=Rhizobium leguminosarum TaxID=384 RepID=UPI0014410BD7|nr:HEAT repeat domain-containing protein [Rhizobium leguminosarum]